MRSYFLPPLTIAILGGLLLTYGVAYAALVTPQDRLRAQASGCCLPTREPAYRAGGKLAERAFAPAWQIDRLVRRHYWQSGAARGG